jgi:hypothetical protein
MPKWPTAFEGNGSDRNDLLLQATSRADGTVGPRSRQTDGMPWASDVRNDLSRCVAMAGVIVGLALSLSACTSRTASSTGANSTTTSGDPSARVSISGSVTAGPTCPVERIGHPCAPTPVRAEVKAMSVGGANEASSPTDAEGHYAFTLPPGSYTFVVVKGSMFPRCTALPVTVSSVALSDVDITCDTGIR